ncbi:hypothetical protein, partial [Aeromonas caviae]
MTIPVTGWLRHLACRPDDANRQIEAYKKAPLIERNAVHLSGAALRFTGKRVFDIFTALGLDGLGR